MYNFRKVPNVESVAAGQTAVAKLPLNPTHHGFTISKLPLSDIDEIRLVINGGTVQRWKGYQLPLYIMFDGAADPGANEFTLWMNRTGLKTRMAEEYTALGTMIQDGPEGVGVKTATLEIDIADAAVSPKLEVKTISTPAIKPAGALKYIRQFNESFSGAGEHSYHDIPKGDKINRIFLFKRGGTGTIDAVRLERDQYRLWDRTAAENTLMQSNGLRVPQADMFVIDPTELGFGDDGIATRRDDGQRVNDLSLYLDIGTGAIDIDILVEYITDLKG